METIKLIQGYYGNKDYGKRAFWIYLNDVRTNEFLFKTDVKDWVKEKQSEGYNVEIIHDNN